MQYICVYIGTLCNRKNNKTDTYDVFFVAI